MKPTPWRMFRMAAWLVALCPGLLSPAPLSAQHARLRHTLEGGESFAATSVVFSPDGKTLAAGSADAVGQRGSGVFRDEKRMNSNEQHYD